jgi:dCMP deaminase
VDQNELKWHLRFLEDAKHKATYSKDPNKKVGCVIMDDRRDPVSYGYNGFPQDFPDDSELYADTRFKADWVVHAEENACARAERDRLEGSTVYIWPFQPCHRCARTLKLHRVKRVVAPVYKDEDNSSWRESFEKARWFFRTVGIELIRIDEETHEVHR